ncbi:PD-(D/E)XK motif protein [Falsiroseomonas oryzae]|uniref:PD-(D/E)XK motif protein n=1 Tax=Falsiroseomonas oryzae TaxID=2766473 RepID=UPI0022EAAE8B|nr:PD-(D/E)XK motif protein [Roseomonas sp. MO-31]
MAPRSDGVRLAEAWRALAGDAGSSGWRIVHLVRLGEVAVLAGRQKPDDREALLIGFHQARLPAPSQLPASRGFAVEAIRHPTLPNLLLLALTRQQGARSDLFEAMAQDLIGLLADALHDDEQAVADAVLARIRAWQDFMSYQRAGILSEDEEIGLHGELVVLEQLLAALPDSAAVVDMWQGPLRGLHDFMLPVGALEAKATTSAIGFRATIGSLEQLDLAIRSPIYLAAVRLAGSDAGSTLPHRVAQLRARLAACSGHAGQSFSARLLRAGYIDAFADRYTRRLTLSDLRWIEVGSDFPLLTAASVPRGVVSARYVIDLDMRALPTTSLTTILEAAGLK